jgi:hypothetical protein
LRDRGCKFVNPSVRFPKQVRRRNAIPKIHLTKFNIKHFIVVSGVRPANLQSAPMNFLDSFLKIPYNPPVIVIKSEGAPILD